MSDLPPDIDPATHALVQAAAKEGVRQTFAMFGVDVDDPKEVEEFRRDLRFGGSMRRLADKSMASFVIVITVGLAGALLLGLKAKLLGS